MTLAVQRRRWAQMCNEDPYHPYSEIVRDLLVDLEQLRDTLIDVHKMDADLPGAIQLKIDMVLLKTGEGL